MTPAPLFSALVRTGPAPGAAALFKGAPPGAADAAAEEAIALGFGGLFYLNAVRERLEDVFSPGTRARLAGVRETTLKDGLATVRFFVDVASALAETGVRCVPLKGVSLMTGGAYPDEGCRATSDLDVLIAPADFPACAALLTRRGYRPLGRTRDGVLENHGQECAFAGPEGEIDVHYRLFPWYVEKHVYKIDGQAMFGRAELRRWPHGEHYFLKREDELRYLLTLAAAGNSWKYRLDADAFVRAHGRGLDWESVERDTLGAPMGAACAATAGFMAARLSTPFPDRFLDRAGRTCGSPRSSPWPGAANAADMAALAGVYFRWNAFKRFGVFKKYFLSRNNPVPSELFR